MELVLWLLLLLTCWLAKIGVQAAYRNGVTDGWGFSRDSGCPGYAKAGEQIEREDPLSYASFIRSHEDRCRIVKYSARIPQDVDDSLQCPPDLM